VVVKSRSLIMSSSAHAVCSRLAEPKLTCMILPFVHLHVLSTSLSYPKATIVYTTLIMAAQRRGYRPRFTPVIFGQPFVKRFALCYLSMPYVLSVCLSICDVGVLWPNG